MKKTSWDFYTGKNLKFLLAQLNKCWYSVKSKYLVKDFFLFSVFMLVTVSMYVPQMYVCYLQKPEQAIRPLGAVTGNCELPDVGAGNRTPGPPQEQTALLLNH